MVHNSILLLITYYAVNKRNRKEVLALPYKDGDNNGNQETPDNKPQNNPEPTPPSSQYITEGDDTPNETREKREDS